MESLSRYLYFFLYFFCCSYTFGILVYSSRLQSIPWYLYDSTPSLVHMDRLNNRKLTYISWNVKGANHPRKRNQILAHLLQLNVDIAFLQERNADVNRIHRSWIGKVFHSRFNSKAKGTAILIRKDIPFETSEIIADLNGRYIIASGLLFNKPVTLARIYAPNWDDEAFIYSLFSTLPNVDSHSIIIGGDLNCALSPDLDRSSTRPGQPLKMAIALNSFMAQVGLCDPWRHKYLNSRAYSFFSPVHHTFSPKLTISSSTLDLFPLSVRSHIIA